VTNVLSQSVEYSLRAVVHLAREGRACTSEEIAGATKVPPAYLSKVLQNLARAGIVLSRRGVGGGFTLARPPAETNLLEIVNAVDPLQRIHRCPLDLPSHGTRLCRLHRRLDDTLQMIEETLRSSTLADMLDESQDIPPLCDVAG